MAKVRRILAIPVKVLAFILIALSALIEGRGDETFPQYMANGFLGPGLLSEIDDSGAANG